MSASQESTALSISLSSTTVSPGETLLVTLKSPTNVRFVVVAVISELGILPASTLPATVPVHIPDDMRPGKYAISAMGRTVANEQVIVGAELLVERTEIPTKLSTRYSECRFMTLGNELPLSIQAELPGGEVVDVTQSSNITYSSSDPRVASVDENGIVMAVSAGNATLTATYTQGNVTRRLVIPAIVPPPAFGVSPTPLDFGDVAVGSKASRNITLTNTTERPLPIPNVAVGLDELFGLRNTCTSSSPLAVGASCTITVTFTPTQAGRLMTLVWIETDDLRTGLSVMGTGVSRE